MPAIDLATIGSYWDHTPNIMQVIINAFLAQVKADEAAYSDSPDGQSATGKYEYFDKQREIARNLSATLALRQLETKSHGKDAPQLAVHGFEGADGKKYHLSFNAADEKGALAPGTLHLTQEPISFHLYYELYFDEAKTPRVRFKPSVTIAGDKNKGKGSSQSDSAELGHLEEPARILFEGLFLAMQAAGHFK